MKIRESNDYFGELISEWKETDMNCYVVTGMQAGSDNSTDTRIGRVVQIRLEDGQFGSDTVLLRHCNNSLISHQNQCFYRVPGNKKEYLDKIFKKVHLDAADKEEYGIAGEDGYVGFIKPSSVKEGASTPMRDIKRQLYNRIDERLNINK